MCHAASASGPLPFQQCPQAVPERPRAVTIYNAVTDAASAHFPPQQHPQAVPARPGAARSGGQGPVAGASARGPRLRTHHAGRGGAVHGNYRRRRVRAVHGESKPQARKIHVSWLYCYAVGLNFILCFCECCLLPPGVTRCAARCVGAEGSLDQELLNNLLQCLQCLRLALPRLDQERVTGLHTFTFKPVCIMPFPTCRR